MTTISTVREMQQAAERFRSAGTTIAVVPTMGAFHDGHLSLIRLAKQHANIVITTLFVNPAQFGPSEDFSQYPRDLEKDSRLATSAGSDILFIPSTEEIYPGDYQTTVEVARVTSMLEGKSRPTHFRGVATVVAKLFNITKPHVAVFGQKDAQQVVVIRQMVKDMNIDLRIVVAPIVREADGLAMSSRNVYLSPPERAQAVVLYQSLDMAAKLVRDGERSSSAILLSMKQLIDSRPLAAIDYLSIADVATLEEVATIAQGMTVLVSLAVRFGATRLIDNTVITVFL